METEEKNRRTYEPPETEFCLQWGNRKRLRCVRVRDPEASDPSTGGRIRRKIASRFVTFSEKESFSLNRLARKSEMPTLRTESRRSAAAVSPEKEERFYTTRGSAVVGVEENGKAAAAEGEVRVEENRGGGGGVWPKVYIGLSSKEKEEDFMAMKGCKLPQRPKKRAKIVQRTLLLVSPGAWLTDMCQERYEVREKKSSKKKPRGLKAMGNLESDSD